MLHYLMVAHLVFRSCSFCLPDGSHLIDDPQTACPIRLRMLSSNT
jgi:hypothetical protein